MRTRIMLLFCFLFGLAADEPTLVTATFLGSPGRDRIEGLAFAGDGTLLVAGSFGETIPGTLLGEPREASQYLTGFVARLDADGREILSLLQFAPGLCHPTSVVEAPDGSIYLAGYASPGMEPLLAPHSPLLGTVATRQKQLTRWAPSVHFNDPRIDARRHDERGVPFVVRLNAGLSQITAGTFLEGWQSVWHVPRPLGEDQWQPVELVALPGGDVLVAHDGGIIADHGDRRPDHRDFYHMPDHVSRLSPDLRSRRWKLDIHTPPNDPEKVRRHLGFDWPHDTLGNTRIHRMRLAPDGETFDIVGWSPSETAKEPWWAPFAFRHRAEDGKRVQTLYTPSPMGGSDDRMHNLVSDSAVRSVHHLPGGDLLYAVKGDGGNSILLRDPRDFRDPSPQGAWDANMWGFAGRTLFWGGVARVDGSTGELRHGLALHGRDKRNRVTPFWPVDLAPLPGDHVAVATRHSTGFRFGDTAWSTDAFPAWSPGGSLLILSETLSHRFSTSLGDVQPFRIESSGSRVALAGAARSDATLRKNCPRGFSGPGDGFLLVFDFAEKEEDAAP